VNLQDPEVAEAFREISTNPANVLKYQGNPKIMSLINKMASKFGGAGMPGGMPSFAGAGFPGAGFPGTGCPGADFPGRPNPPKPAPEDDVGLD